MAFSGLIAGAKNGTSTGCTTDAVDTTGKDIICVFASWFGNGSASISDSKGNTWSTNGKIYNGSSNAALQLWWCVSPTVGSGHTFTITADYCSAGYVAAAGVNTADAFDQEITATPASSSTHQPGSLTPDQDNCLLVTAIGALGSNNPIGVDGTYAEVLVANSSGNGLGLGIGYEAQTTATAANPTWTVVTAPASVLVASFHAAAASSAAGPLIGGKLVGSGILAGGRLAQ